MQYILQYICIALFNVYLYYNLFKEVFMAFRIKSDKKETENKTIRFPLELINEIEKAIVGKDVSFSGFVIQACDYALKNMEDNEKKSTSE